MDPVYALPLLLIPILIVVAVYVLAWRGKSSRSRKSGHAIAATAMGLIAIFGSWWALGMTIGIWSVDGSGHGPSKIGEILLALGLEIFVLLFPFCGWYFCIRFAKAVSKANDRNLPPPVLK